MSVEQVIAELQPQGMAPLPEELRQQGLAAELDEHGRVRVRRTAAAGVAGGDSMARTAGLRAGGVERAGWKSGRWKWGRKGVQPRAGVGGVGGTGLHPPR